MEAKQEDDALVKGWSAGRDTIDANFVADLLLGLGQIDPQLADKALT
jgi:hypothetical protein